ncbi:MAG: tyrosine-type recombinase/integrase [Promethearchaeota archaeon]|jgi:integrase/recombinase XerD
MNELEICKEKYIEELRVRNYAQTTIINKDIRLKEFIEYLKRAEITQYSEMTENHLKAYQEYRYYKENRFKKVDSIAVQNRHISVVKSYLKYLVKTGKINHDPGANITLARQPKFLPKEALTDKEMKKLLKSIDENNVIGYKNRTILEVLYTTGIRRRELINIKLEDVMLKSGFIRINQGKGKKDRMVPIGKIASKYIENYIKHVRENIKTAKTSEYLFPGQRKEKIAVNIINKMLKVYAKKANIKKEVTSHTIRRSCATEMIKREANVMYVKELLGHSSLESLDKYCRLTAIDLKKAHRKYHPRENDMV